MSPRLFRDVALIEARSRMAYRADFWVSALLGFALELALAWFLWSAVFRESGATQIGGYTPEAMLLYYVAVLLFGRVVRGPELVGGVSNDIYEGGLNRYLVFPTGYFSFKYAQHLGGLVPALVQLALLGTVLPLLLTPQAAAGVTAGTIAMSLVSVFAANLLLFALNFSLQCVAFWADNVWSLGVALRFVSGLLGGNLLPLTVFPDALQPALQWLPFRYLYDQPVNVLLGRVDVATWLVGLFLCGLWTLIAAGLASWVWRRGTLQYSGIGM